MTDIAHETVYSIQGRKTQPIKIWAVIGVAFLVLEIYVFSMWFISGQAERIFPPADSPVPLWLDNLAMFFDIFSPVMLIVFFYTFVYKPWKQNGYISSDGLIILAFTPMYFQDPLINYNTNWFLFNSAHFNLGVWVEQVPGALAPNAHLLPEPILTWGIAYIWNMLAITLLACWAMRITKRYRPETGSLGLLLVALVAAGIVDILMELLFVRPGLYAYAGAIRSLSLWGGETYQFPLYEMVACAFLWGICAQLRYYKDDKGFMWCERGTEELKNSRGTKTGLRLLALHGCLNVIMLVTYTLPMQTFGMHGDPFPEGYPGYLLNGLCGNGTNYECPGPHVPMPRGTPEGKYSIAIKPLDKSTFRPGSIEGIEVIPYTGPPLNNGAQDEQAP